MDRKHATGAAARKGAGKEKIKAAVLRAKMPLEPIFVYTI